MDAYCKAGYLESAALASQHSLALELALAKFDMIATIGAADEVQVQTMHD